MLRPGGLLVAADSLWSEELEAFHDGDTYLPVDPTGLHERLERAGFVDVDVRVGDARWAASARAAPR